tara:strand:- start:87 stop:596 length:510 start_codon:yes stop_codon:yes gene_type:complete
MNIFVLSQNPITAAKMMCDKHIPKMIVESAQMMASALRRHGATDDMMPLTKAGTPYKGGYKHHPCTVWVGDSYANFMWLSHHAEALLDEYYERFGKVHACHNPIYQMSSMKSVFATSTRDYLTPFAQAMPDEYKNRCAVTAYRNYYHSKTFAKWEKGTPSPKWWRGANV